MPRRLSYGSPGVLHGSFSYVMQDDDGQTCDVHSVSAGLDYPGVGPEHSYWKDTGRVQYTSCRDDAALAAFDQLARSEGILPALESSHAVAKALRLAATRPADAVDRRLPVGPRRQRRRRNRPAARDHVRLDTRLGKPLAPDLAARSVRTSFRFRSNQGRFLSRCNRMSAIDTLFKSFVPSGRRR